jgi:hypothetical protein
LRTGIRGLLERADSDDVLVTASGQHPPADILAVAAVARRSQVGNHLTRLVFRLLTGSRLADTRSGLRAISRPLLQRLLR